MNFSSKVAGTLSRGFISVFYLCWKAWSLKAWSWKDSSAWPGCFIHLEKGGKDPAGWEHPGSHPSSPPLLGTIPTLFLLFGIPGSAKEWNVGNQGFIIHRNVPIPIPGWEHFSQETFQSLLWNFPSYLRGCFLQGSIPLWRENPGRSKGFLRLLVAS